LELKFSTEDYRFLLYSSVVKDFKDYYPKRNIDSIRKTQDFQLKEQMNAAISALNISDRTKDDKIFRTK